MTRSLPQRKSIRGRTAARARKQPDSPGVERAPQLARSRPSVSIIVPVFNQAGLTAQCLQAIVGREAAEVIVVDDASTDGTRELLAASGPAIRPVIRTHNGGFAQACNDGAAAAAGEFLVILNNDTIPQRGWLDALLRYAGAHPEAAVVGAKLLYPNDTVQHAGVVICQDRYPRHIYSGFPANHPAVNKSRAFPIVTAACLLVRRDLFLAQGGFDTAFRNGFEDVDFCLRLGQAGLGVHYCAESVLYHLESSSPGRFRFDKTNVALFRERWIDRVQPDDLKYYLEDGLLEFTYEGSFPFRFRLSPRLAVLESDDRKRDSELLLGEQARQKAELTRENARLHAELGKSGLDSPLVKYDQVRAGVRQQIRESIPAHAKVLVVSKGDGLLLELGTCTAQHFPQTEAGAYAGHHPADSGTAIAHLESLRSKGADYLVFPNTAYWWLEHYREFAHHLQTHYRSLPESAGVCRIYDLRAAPGTLNQKTLLSSVSTSS